MNMVDKISREKNIDKTSALKILVTAGWREISLEKALHLYREGKISVDKAAKISDITVSEMMDEIVAHNIKSEETIANTERFAREIVKYPNLTQLYCAMLTPFPATPMNRKFLKANPEYAERDIWDTEQTKRFWIDNYCEADYDYIEAKAREINDLNPSSRKRYFGLKRD
jgi:predicted HTH domain antitoxin